MAISEKSLKLYKKMLNYLDSKDWHYEKDDEELNIKCITQGDDLPIPVRMFLDDERDVLRFCSTMPFKVPEDKRIEAAVAIAATNYGLINGSFDYDFRDGEVTFRMTTTYIGDTVLDETVIEYMLIVSAKTIDDYNDKLYMFCKGSLSLKEYLDQIL